MPQHVRANAANAARFYVATAVYDPVNVPNLALHEALRVVETLPLSSFLRARARGVRHAFPELSPWQADGDAIARVRLGRKTVFCYHDLFASPRSMLLYPSITAASYLGDPGAYVGHDW